MHFMAKKPNNLLVSNLVVSECKEISSTVRSAKERCRYSLEHGVSVALRRVVHVGIVQQVLDTQQDLQRNLNPWTFKMTRNCTHLLDRDGGLPRLFLIENRKTYRTRGVHIGVEQWR
jgi:hypothetical protein